MYNLFANSTGFLISRFYFCFSWGRWREIMGQGQFRKGWREIDVENCSRMMVRIIQFLVRLQKIQVEPDW